MPPPSPSCSKAIPSSGPHLAMLTTERKWQHGELPTYTRPGGSPKRRLFTQRWLPAQRANETSSIVRGDRSSEIDTALRTGCLPLEACLIGIEKDPGSDLTNNGDRPVERVVAISYFGSER